MESYHPSLRAQARALEPLTPNHSPHGSVNSLSSSRTPLHTLTLHEYRKQQNSPASHATPTGKTLRRKAAAPALHKTERVASASSSRPLHFAQSAWQLTSYQALPPSPPHIGARHHDDRLLRSQSAEPYSQGGPVSSETTLNIGGKIGKFKAIKRLPKPPISTRFRPSLPLLANVTPPHQQPSPLRTTSFAPVDYSTTSDSQPTPSTFSLSRFPQPPPFGRSFSPSDAECHLRLNTTNFPTAAPATPPATPAVIHYRGTSFDLVNPHESLWYHDIVTPPREANSTDYLPLQSSEDLFSSSEMAPKRAVYGDFASAYNNIACRHDSNADFSAAPTPAAHTPGSSPYSTPVHSPELELDGPQAAVRQPATGSGFSLKKLTQTLTHHLSRTSKTEQPYEEELQDLPTQFDKHPNFGKEYLEGDHSLIKATYGGGNPEADFATSFDSGEPLHTSPAANWMPSQRNNQEVQWPLDRAMDIMNGSRPSFKDCSSPYASHPETMQLASIVPDEPSTPVRRGVAAHSLTSGGASSRPYYEDMASMYSDSIYTEDGLPRSRCSLALSNKRKSVTLDRTSLDVKALADEYRSDVYVYADSQSTGHGDSKPLDQELLFHAAQKQGVDQTDTISKFIDNYKHVESTGSSKQSTANQISANCTVPGASLSAGFEESLASNRIDTNETTSSVDDGFQLHTPEYAGTADGNESEATEPIGLDRQRMAIETAREPPSMPAPLAPPFEYDEMVLPTEQHDPSDVFSGTPSYGDTRQLLQLSQPSQSTYAEQGLEPSSSYSQTEVAPSPTTPQAALELAGQIFEDASKERNDAAIPAMWARRNSGNLLRRTNNNERISVHPLEDTIHADEKYEVPVDDGIVALSSKAENVELTVEGQDDEPPVEDWETIPTTNRASGHFSIGESLANVSTDSGSSRGDLGYSISFLPNYENEPQDPSPLCAPRRSLHSSPPNYMMHTSIQSVTPSGPPDSSIPNPPASAPTVPGFAGLVWMNTSSPPSLDAQRDYDAAMGLSNKETEELLRTGPNEEIIFEGDENHLGQNSTYGAHVSGGYVGGLDRDNTFDKFTTIGPKGNLTGTPQGTGINEVGSSEANNSSPGAALGSSSPTTFAHNRTRPYGTRPYSSLRESTGRMFNIQPGHSAFATPMHAQFGPGSSSSSPEHGGFYTTPGKRSSITRVTPGASFPRQVPELELSPSQVTLFPRPVPSPPRTPRPARTYSRAAVPGQTRLREMILAPETMSLASTRRSQDESEISRIIREDSARPSTSHTNTPLRLPRHKPFVPSVVADRLSPHLLCREVPESPEEEAARNNISWLLLAPCLVFTFLLPFYYRHGDSVITLVSRNKHRSISANPKRVAFAAGIVMNGCIITGLVIWFAVQRAKGVF